LPRRIANIIVRFFTAGKKWIPYTFTYCDKCRKYVRRNHEHQENLRATGLRGIRKPKIRYRFKSRKEIPDVIDYEPIFEKAGYYPPDQGNQGSCTAQCGINDKAFQEIIAGTFTGQNSAAQLYWDIRDIDGETEHDSGGWMDQIGGVLGGTMKGQKVPDKLGVCLNKTMPYNQFDYKTQPSTKAYTEAKDYKCDPKQEAFYIDDIPDFLVEKKLPRIGIPITVSFNESLYNGGYVPETNDDRVRGYHAVTVVGKTPKYVKCMNSWGKITQARGYFYITWGELEYQESKGRVVCYAQKDHKDPSPKPNPVECIEGDTIILETCPNGSWKKRQRCVNNKWITEEQECDNPSPLPDNIWKGWSGATFFFLVVALVVAMFLAAYADIMRLYPGAMNYIPMILNYWCVIVGMIWGINLGKNLAYKHYYKKLMGEDYGK